MSGRRKVKAIALFIFSIQFTSSKTFIYYIKTIKTTMKVKTRF